jgi:hypothetical protein
MSVKLVPTFIFPFLLFPPSHGFVDFVWYTFEKLRVILGYSARIVCYRKQKFCQYKTRNYEGDEDSDPNFI